MNSKVYVIECADYDQVEDKLPELIGLMGGIERFASRGERLALKVNLLLEAAPEQAVTTHPKVVSAMGKLVRGAGAEGVIVDSPGSGFRYTSKVLEGIYQTSGMVQAAGESGVRLNTDTTFETISYAEGKFIKRFEVITPVLKADGVLNLCKLKSHCFTSMTGAVKNNFGVIPGRAKPGYHQKLSDRGRFVRMLLDLAGFVAPRISIMDAVVAMEGDGPSAGNPRPLGLILGAENPLALDVIAGEIIGLPREKNPFLLEAERMGLFPHHINQVELVGADISQLRIPDFKFPPTIYEGTGLGGHLKWWQRLLEPVFKDALTLKPRIKKVLCQACGACYGACPAGAIKLQRRGKKPFAEIDDNKCIRCYCCHEMCQEKAVYLHKSLLHRFSNR
jgi:uncharacterized protein (DUF362 family)/ferredoxin